jgi:hypothetical protein
VQLIVLWDVDHTLVDNAGVSKEIYASAFKALVGRDAELPAPTEGRTHRAIMREMFVRHNCRLPDGPRRSERWKKPGGAERKICGDGVGFCPVSRTR